MLRCRERSAERSAGCKGRALRGRGLEVTSPYNSSADVVDEIKRRKLCRCGFFNVLVFDWSVRCPCQVRYMSHHCADASDRHLQV